MAFPRKLLLYSSRQITSLHSMEGVGNLSTVVKSLYPKANKLVLGDQFPSDFGVRLYIGLVEKVTYFQDFFSFTTT